ncbi:MAG: hypothetical protein L0H96_18290 [Humibacillus sp.]|nr:hypothetical protein [Humibacillus sp.]MDN5778849.1 hypothetical protein [Humibacillus sp.]
MSNDDTGGTDQDEQGTPEAPALTGIPGYPSNTHVPGGFVLPLPKGVADEVTNDPSGEPADEAVADPWSSSWDERGSQAWRTPEVVGADDTDETDDADGVREDTDALLGAGVDIGSGAGSAEADEVWSGWTPAGGAPSSRAARRSRGQNGNGPRPTGPTEPAEPNRLDDVAAEQTTAAATPGLDPDVAPTQRETRAGGPASAPEPAARSIERPSADDLMTARSKGERQKTKATTGIRKAFGLGPGIKELTERDRLERIGRPLHGRKTVMVINTKGGGGKTLVTLMLASYLGRYRSGSVLAWDNNETEGTLGMRAPSQPHHRTVVDLLGALPQIADDPNAGTSELAHWVREQRGIGFDVLASADDDEAMRIIGEDEFESLHMQLSRFYRMIVVDTGNNRLSPNWLAAAAHADLLVFATSLKDDTSVVAAKNLDALVAMGRQDLVQNAVCVISHTSLRGTDLGAGVHTREHFEKWVRTVVDIPYDPLLAPGLRLDPTKIGKRTHEACLELAASVVDGL